jgi:membrane fusion protein (multidrug efflux system)
MIQTAEAIGDKWVVSSGLNAGEKVIIEGLLKAKPGNEVVPEPFHPKAETSQAQVPGNKKG